MKHRHLFTVIFVMVLLFINGSAASAATKNVTPDQLRGRSREEVVEMVGPLFTADQEKNGILASINMAQFLLETGFGQSELFRNTNNGFGMNSILSRNTWSGSAWDGRSKYRKQDKGWVLGRQYTYWTYFRKYSSFSASIADHSAYLKGAANGDGTLRYKGIDTQTDYKKACRIISEGGYAQAKTRTAYSDSLISIIERYNLTRFHAKKSAAKVSTKTTSNVARKSGYQTGTYTCVVPRNDTLNARKSPNAKATIVGRFSYGDKLQIVEVKGNWGRFKSGSSTGWVNLGFCQYGKTADTNKSDKSDKYLVVTKDGLNIRRSGRASASILGCIPYNKTFTVAKYSGKWGYVTYGGKSGWVNTGYAQKVK